MRVPSAEGEHRVQGLAEPVDLVLRLRERQTLPRPLAGDLVGAASHRLDGSQRRGRKDVARDGREEKRERTDDEELGEQSVERFLPVLERSSDNEDELLSCDRRDQQPRLPVDALDVAREVERAVARSLNLRRGDDRRAVRIDDLCEGFVVPGGEKRVRPLFTYERREVPARAARLSSSCSSRESPSRT